MTVLRILTLAALLLHLFSVSSGLHCSLPGGSLSLATSINFPAAGAPEDYLSNVLGH